MFDLSTVDLIMTGFAGLTVIGVTQVIKQFLKASGAGAIAISILVSAGFTAYYLISNAMFSVPLMIGYTLLVAAVANGVFKALHTPNPIK